MMGLRTARVREGEVGVPATGDITAGVVTVAGPIWVVTGVVAAGVPVPWANANACWSKFGEDGVDDMVRRVRT
jgi:hypothetical protein